jgi:hypothetical protein
LRSNSPTTSLQGAQATVHYDPGTSPTPLALALSISNDDGESSGLANLRKLILEQYHEFLNIFNKSGAIKPSTL